MSFSVMSFCSGRASRSGAFELLIGLLIVILALAAENVLQDSALLVAAKSVLQGLDRIVVVCAEAVNAAANMTAKTPRILFLMDEWH